MVVLQVGNIILGIAVIATIIIFIIASIFIASSVYLNCPNTGSSNKLVQAFKRLCDSSGYLYITIPAIVMAYFFIRVITLQTKGN